MVSLTHESPMMLDSLAVVQPNIPTPQPSSVVLILVGHKMVDLGRDPGLEWISIQVRAVSGHQGGIQTSFVGSTSRDRSFTKRK